MPRKEHLERPPEEKDEGPRSFSVFLQSLAEGAAESEISAELQLLVQATRVTAEMRRKSVKGTLALNLSVECDDAGIVRVGYEIKAKPPKVPTYVSTYWTTKGGNLTPNNPKQLQLGVRDLDAPPAPARDLGVPAAIAREV